MPPSTCLFPNLLVLGEAGNHLHILICQFPHGHLVVLLGHVIGQDDCGKDREAIGSVEGAIVVVVVDASQLLGRGSGQGGSQSGQDPHTASSALPWVSLSTLQASP